MWQQRLADAKLEQSVENGFGETSLKKYRRHIFLLHPNKVVIYDELEAAKPVRWDWLLHSPTKFGVEDATNTLTTKGERFIAVARLFSEQPCTISQTDEYAAEPNEKGAVRGEGFSKPWSLTASFGPSPVNRVLTIIQVEADGSRAVEIVRSSDGKFQCGNWTIEAELNSKRPASLSIQNAQTKAAFSYGTKEAGDASLLYDCIDGVWKTEKRVDCKRQLTGSK